MKTVSLRSNSEEEWEEDEDWTEEQDEPKWIEDW